MLTKYKVVLAKKKKNGSSWGQVPKNPLSGFIRVLAVGCEVNKK
jgi:hypothetical protein